MKTTQTARFPTKSIAVRFLFSVIIVSGLIIPSAAFAQDAAKTHTLFMGADVSVGRETDKDVHAVKDVTGSSWVIDVGGQSTVVSAKSGPLNIRVTPVLKLTEVSATIGKLKSDRGYTEANDPTALMTRNLAQTAVQNADYNASVNQATAVQNGAIGASEMGVNTNIVPGPGAPPPSSQQKAATLTEALACAQHGVNAAAGGVGADYSMGEREVRSQGFDAMDVDFEISSARPLQNPYVVTMTKFHPAGTKEGTVQNLVYAKSLDPIDSHPTRVHFVEGGFPFNFDLIDFQLHVYNQGKEIATNVSSKRVELTRDEAFEYVKMEYVGAHKGETLAAAPVMGKLPADLPARLADGKYGDTFYVKVSKDGLAEEPFLDAACTKRISDPYLESVVKGVRFKPALENGSPVNGVAALKLGQLAI